ncbi:hypothetical protein DIPPA_25432 [Diplonema papillatum]|nr:hypothetical protein DIPPA_25432 [Diplonema papillatum]
MSGDHADFISTVNSPSFRPLFHRLATSTNTVAICLCKQQSTGMADDKDDDCRPDQTDILTLCYTDMADELFQATLTYDALRKKRDSQRKKLVAELMKGIDRIDGAAAPVGDHEFACGVSTVNDVGYWTWQPWLGRLLKGLAHNTVSTTWKGGNADGLEVLSVEVPQSFCFSQGGGSSASQTGASQPARDPIRVGSRLSFSLTSVRGSQLVIQRSQIAFGMMAAIADLHEHAAAAREKLAVAHKELAAERSKSAALQHSLAAFGSAGAGIEAHQKPDDGRKASQKRKAQSLVNPTEKVRRPRGTRIAS